MRNIGKNLLCGSMVLIIAILYFYVKHEDNFSEYDLITENQLLIANTTAITKLNTENETFNLYFNSEKTNDFWIGGLDCSYELGGVYFSDMENAKLYALKNNTNESRLVFSGHEHWFPICLAVEDVSGKLYVGDLIQGGLTVHDIKTGDSSVILGAGLLLCVTVAVDVQEKYIFVVDKYQILRLDLDGKNAKTIHELADKINLDFSGRRFRHGPEKSRIYIGVDGMSLDRKRKRIYWASGRDKKIESSDYNGDHRQIHFRDVNVFGDGRSSSNSLAILHNLIYWADPIERRIVKIKSTVDYEIVYSEFDHATLASCERRGRKIENSCAGNNGGCQHLCLLSRSNYYGYSCTCKFGYELEKDEKSCRLVHDYLLFMEGGIIKGLSLGEKSAFVFQPPGISANENSLIDIDIDSAIIYYTRNVENNEIKLHEQLIDASAKPKVLSPDLFGRQVKNFAYDWTTKNLYYLSQYYQDAMTLSVTNTRDPRYGKILIKNLFDATTMRFFGPVVHPNKGYLFLVVIGGKSSRGEIKRMSLDGSDIKVIYKVGAKNSIGGLALDYENDRIYWGEVRESGISYWQSSIKNSNLNGEYISEFDLTKDLEMPIGIAIYRNYIYGIDVGKRLFRMNKDGKYLRILVESGHLGYSVKIHSRELQVTRDDHPCKNHKCSKFCFAVPGKEGKLKGVCGCPYGQKLANDDFSCVDNSNVEPAFKVCDDKDTCKMLL